MGGYQLGIQCRLNAELVRRQIEQRRQIAPIGQLVVRLSQLVEERMGARLERRDARRRRVLEQLANQLDGFLGRAWTKHFVPRVGAYLWKLKFLIVGVHLSDLVARWRAEHFYDLD